ncbi:MAG: hypothetical protein GXP11_11145 [Gammaproteobacteria bacterium]|nr:hypothetical protein [Gammaproteobacteria bacterium]
MRRKSITAILKRSLQMRKFTAIRIFMVSMIQMLIDSRAFVCCLGITNGDKSTEQKKQKPKADKRSTFRQAAKRIHSTDLVCKWLVIMTGIVADSSWFLFKPFRHFQYFQ